MVCGESSCPKLVYRNFESVAKFDVGMRLPGVYRRIYDESTFECSFLSIRGLSIFRSGLNFIVSNVALCSIGLVRGVVKLSKIGLQEFRIRIKFEVGLRLQGLYRMR